MYYLPIISNTTYLLGSIILLINSVLTFRDVTLLVGILNVIGMSLFVIGSLTHVTTDIVYLKRRRYKSNKIRPNKIDKPTVNPQESS